MLGLVRTTEEILNETDQVAFDLCLLSECSHSVHTHGTFGTWGSLLAGGEVIAPTGTNPDSMTEDDIIWQRAAMPGWVYLDVRDVKNIQEVLLTSPTTIQTPNTSITTII